MSDKDDWQEVWNVRCAALESLLGTADDRVLHAPVPLSLDGDADVLVFSHSLPGIAYVTADMTGKPESAETDYELMICHRTPHDWGPSIISRLARYAIENPLLAGQTMDMGPAFPEGSHLHAFIFTTFSTFQLFGRTNALRLCLGITQDELEYCFQNGADALIAELTHRDIYPFTDLDRRSILSH